MSRNKTNPKKLGIRITQDALLKIVADRTSLTQPQVKECVDIMFATLEEFLLHPDCPTTFEWKIGTIGKLTLKPRMGRKAGTYKRPDNFKKGTLIEEVLEHEEPSRQYLAFSPYPSFKAKLTLASIFRATNQKWSKIETVGYDDDGKPIKKVKEYSGWKARLGKIYPLDWDDGVK